MGLYSKRKFELTDEEYDAFAAAPSEAEAEAVLRQAAEKRGAAMVVAHDEPGVFKAVLPQRIDHA